MRHSSKTPVVSQQLFDTCRLKINLILSKLKMLMEIFLVTNPRREGLLLHGSNTIEDQRNIVNMEPGLRDIYVSFRVFS